MDKLERVQKSNEISLTQILRFLIPTTLCLTGIILISRWLFWPLMPVNWDIGVSGPSLLSSVNFLVSGLLFICLLNVQSSSIGTQLKKTFFWFLWFWLFFSSLSVLASFLGHLNFSAEILLFPKTQVENRGHIDFMSPSTAICFIFTSLLLLSDYLTRQYQPIKLSLAIVPLFLSGTLLISHAYETPFIEEFAIFESMSITSAAVFFVLHFVWALYRVLDLFPLPIRSEDKPLYAGFTVILLAFVALGMISSRSLILLNAVHRTQVETQERMKAIQSLLKGLIDVETGARGYTITGLKKFLEPYYEGVRTYHYFLAQIQFHEMHLSKSQKETIKEIENLADLRIQHSEEMIRLREKKGYDHARFFAAEGRGKELMDQIRLRVDRVDAENLLALKKQGRSNQYQATITLISVTLGSLMAGIILAICFIFYRRNDQKRIEAELQIQNLNRSLSYKLRETEMLNKELESFSYSVSHDLRAPLRAMSGFGQILVEDLGPQLNSKDAEYLTRIVTASNKMSRLIDGLLVLSRLTRTSIKLEKQNVKNIVESLRREFEQLEGKREINYQFYGGSEVYADEALFILLIQNLLGNAWKFTSKTPHAKIEIGSFEKGGETVYYIKDNGAGFDMKYANKLFGTFQRLHFDHEFEGTGIGLATSKRIINMHGGEIWAEGFVNQGATFYFYFPVKGKHAEWSH